MIKTRPKIIGITGGIGSGKTTAANHFQTLGFPLYNSDLRARYIQNNSPEVIQQITKLFGSDSYTNDGLNRAYIASQVFNNKEKIKQLNQIVHPAVFKDFEDWIEKQETKFVIKEAAILIESGSYKDCHIIISILADAEIRINRAINRDQLSREAILSRISNQITDEERASYSDYIINNSKDLDYLYKQVEKITDEIKNNTNFED